LAPEGVPCTPRETAIQPAVVLKLEEGSVLAAHRAAGNPSP